MVDGIRTLKDVKPDRRVSAGFTPDQLMGHATIYLRVAHGVWQNFQIVDTNPHAVCVSARYPPHKKLMPLSTTLSLELTGQTAIKGSSTLSRVNGAVWRATSSIRHLFPASTIRTN